MSKIAIVTDTGSDLSDDVAAKYGITLVPLVVRFGTDTYLDRQLTHDELWNMIDQGAPHPGTSQPSAGMFEEAFAPLVEQGNHVLCVTLTSKHSGTFNSAYAASQRFPERVTVFDSLSLSLCLGYQAICAAKAAAEGQALEHILATLESLRDRTQLFIVLDTIEYLRRGGRADQLMPVLERVARVLSIKPIVQVIDGQLSLLGAGRSFEKALQRIQQEVAKRGPAEMLMAVHTRMGDDVPGFARALAERLAFPFQQVMIAEAGPALSCHAGPGVLAAGIVQRSD